MMVSDPCKDYNDIPLNSPQFRARLPSAIEIRWIVSGLEVLTAVGQTDGLLPSTCALDGTFVTCTSHSGYFCLMAIHRVRFEGYFDVFILIKWYCCLIYPKILIISPLSANLSGDQISWKFVTTCENVGGHNLPWHLRLLYVCFFTEGILIHNNNNN